MEQSVIENRPENGETPQGQSRANPLDLAWLAGLVDGEGSINLGRSFAKGGYNSTKTLVDISMCSKAAVEKAAELIYLVTHKKYPVKERIYSQAKHVVYSLRVIDQKGCRKVCEALMPYLVAKKEMADIMIKFCQSRQALKAGKQGSRYSDYELGLIAQCKVAIRGAYTTPKAGSVETMGVCPT